MSDQSQGLLPSDLDKAIEYLENAKRAGILPERFTNLVCDAAKRSQELQERLNLLKAKYHEQ